MIQKKSKWLKIIKDLSILQVSLNCLPSQVHLNSICLSTCETIQGRQLCREHRLLEHTLEGSSSEVTEQLQGMSTGSVSQHHPVDETDGNKSLVVHTAELSEVPTQVFSCQKFLNLKKNLYLGYNFCCYCHLQSLRFFYFNKGWQDMSVS